MTQKTRHVLVALALLLGVALRLAAATSGYNVDVQHFDLVGNLTDSGKVVYSHTHWYNYGPLWAHVLAGLKKTQHFMGLTSLQSFHFMIASLLTWVDLLISWTLAYWIAPSLGLLYFLNPVSILITGYHSQFEALAILFGLWSWLLLRPRTEESAATWATLLASACLLGLSLVTKHLLIFLPLWILWYKPAGPWTRRMVYCAVAYGVFLLSFAPYLGDAAAKAGIMSNVFGYHSFSEAAFFPRVLDVLRLEPMLDQIFGWVPIFPGWRALWPILTLAVGYYVARRFSGDLFFLYLVSLLVLAPALSIQQLAIPIAACAYFWNSAQFWNRWAMRLYTLATTCLLLSSDYNVAANASVRPYVGWAIAMNLRFYHVIAFLAAFLLLYLWPRRVHSTPLDARLG